MADYQKAALELLQIFLQPFRHYNIQMVRRFVQNHKVRVTHQRRRQHQTCFLTAAQRRCILLPPALGIAKADEHTLDAVLKIIAVNKFIALQHAAIFLKARVQRLACQLGRIRLQLRQLRTQAGNLRAGLQHKLPDSAVNLRKALLYIAHADAGLELDSAAVNPFRVQQTAQHRCLAAAVDADQTDVLALLNHKAYIFKNFVNAKGLGNFIYY